MDEKKQIIKFETSKDITDFLDQPTLKIAEALTGILSSPLSNLKLSIGKVLQAGVKGRLLSQFGGNSKLFQKRRDKEGLSRKRDKSKFFMRSIHLR